jgi:hypothetical protein
VSSHQFLRSLLQFYSLDLHHFDLWAPMRLSPCSRVAVLSPIITGGTVWLKWTSTGYNPCQRPFGDCCKGD